MKVALIPALSGSTRVEDKNLILLDGYPAMHYCVTAAVASGVFDQVYVMSDILCLRDMAEDLGAVFIERDPSRGGTSCTMANASASCEGSRCQVHDHFLFDFMGKVPEATHVFQIHTTSPLLSKEYIADFVNAMTSSDTDSQFAICEDNIETLIDGVPANFDPKRKRPTQSLAKTQTISWAISGWRRESFVSSYEDGPTFNGKVVFRPIPKLDSLELDSPEDLYIIEACLSHRESASDVGRFKYNPEIVVGIEEDLGSLIARDGSPLTADFESNRKLLSLPEAKRYLEGRSGTVPVILSDRDQVGLIYQHKGEGCRRHLHSTKSEFWHIVEGSFLYETWKYRDEGHLPDDPDDRFTADAGSTVFLEKGTIHTITCISESGIRLACGARNMAHIYV